MRIPKVIKGLLLVALVGATSVPAAQAVSYGVSSAYEGSRLTAQGYGTVTVGFLQATHTGWARQPIASGRGAYVVARATNIQQTVTLRNPNTKSSTYVKTTKTAGYGAPTQGPWYGWGKACVDIELWFDPCGAETGGPA